jgi:hypothetical protein
MKSPYRRFFHHPSALFVAIAMAGALVGSHSFAAPNGPTGKLYVSDLKGSVDLHTSDAIIALAKKKVFNATGTTIFCAQDSNCSMVYSNGTAMYLDTNSRLEVQKFTQEPFTFNRYDLETEPSVSQTLAHLSYGLVALCTSKLAAGSNMIYTTPHVMLNIRGKKIVIESNNYQTLVSVLEGDVTVRASDGGGGQVLRNGQEAIVRYKTTNQTSSIVHVGRIPDERKRLLDELVDMADIAQRTVYFETVDRKDATGKTTQEIQASEVVPTNKPTNFTISPSQLPQ